MRGFRSLEFKNKMLDLLGSRSDQFCDGLSRRRLLRLGGLAMSGLTLPDVLKAEFRSGIRSSHKGIIMIYLPGGPPHQDTWEIKTEAPSEMRGEFKPIATSVPGIQIGELFPRLAAMMDKLIILRALVGARNEHESNICYSGHTRLEFEQQEQPCLGSFLSKIQGSVAGGVPPFVSLVEQTVHTPWASPGEPGVLGRVHGAFMPAKVGKDNLTLKSSLGVDRLADRVSLLDQLNCFRQVADVSGRVDSLDGFTQSAVDLLTSHRIADALDLEKIDSKTRERYRGDLPVLKIGTHPGRWHTEQFLTARRLIQAGVRCVTLNFSTWDTHLNNFERIRLNAPYIDRGVTALIEDLEVQGMLDDVTVVVWGEMGRTPKINNKGGRDHWPAVSCALLAGGGMPTGQVIGRTSRLGDAPADRPIHYQEVFATLYHNLGIDVSQLTITDQNGRDRHLLEHRELIQELV